MDVAAKKVVTAFVGNGTLVAKSVFRQCLNWLNYAI
jgi:hypothetical protein